MKTIKLILLNILLVGALMSCQKEDVTNETDITQKTPTKEQLIKLNALGISNTAVTIEKVINLDGSSEDYFLNDTDLAIPVEGLFDLGDLESLDNGTKQYRTRNLVSSANRTIDVLGYTGGSNALNSTNRQALQRAVNNYNRLNSTLNMRLTFGTNYRAADITVYVQSNLGAGGLAGFPSQGRPYQWARIGPSVSNRGLGYATHVITHEIGHCIGLRHTDWFRRYCDGSNEGQSSEGAIHIPGTPTGIDISSTMMSCPTGYEDGNFNRNDIIAIEYLY
ncbi:M57 family metalloprotease [Aquimarina celericrescens]|uniref:M57 family metalloprotease n=1 Tax=Aquimarina celericrescens TaxID=1964542 RepID=A0ABW5B112_9FLAO|nr:peptidase [Aquimarina celericrescens]